MCRCLQIWYTQCSADIFNINPIDISLCPSDFVAAAAAAVSASVQYWYQLCCDFYCCPNCLCKAHLCSSGAMLWCQSLTTLVEAIIYRLRCDQHHLHHFLCRKKSGRQTRSLTLVPKTGKNSEMVMMKNWPSGAVVPLLNFTH